MATDPLMQWRFVESCRQHLQGDFDSKQSALQRNINGQYATPFDLAFSIVEIALSYQVQSINEISILEPSIGFGAFYSAVLKYTCGKSPNKAVGYEKNFELANKASMLWNPMGLIVHNSDFTCQVSPTKEENKFNVVLANPPYVRHQHMKGQKDRLGLLVEAQFGWRPSGLMGLYGYFILLAHDWMKEDAIGAWIIPREYFDVKYGMAIKNTFLRR